MHRLRLLPPTLAALGGAALLAAPGSARAEGKVAVSPSVSFSVSFGQKIAYGLGLDLRVTGLVDGKIGTCNDDPRRGFGGFAQATWLVNLNAARFAAGVHGGGEIVNQMAAVDGELGWTYRTRVDDEHPGQHGLHLGALGLFTFVPIAYVPSLELPVRLAIPLSGGPIRTPEIIPGLGARIPQMFGIATGGCVIGRPMRTDEGVLVPPVFALRERAARRLSIDRASRAALADVWIDDARAECASIPTFVALARDLAACGAPAALVARALVAADDEVRHTQLCRELAGDLAGLEIDPLLYLPPPASDADRRDALLRMALEAWFDGALGEGAAADRAARAARDAAEPTTRAALAAIARDEHRHAELGWAVLAHCLAAGGTEVSDALAQALDSPAKEPPPADPDRGADPAARRAFGRLAQADVDVSWRETESLARRRGAALLA